MSLIKVNTIQNANGTTALTIAANGQLSRVNTAIISDGTNSTSATNVIQGSAKAWVNFNGTGTVAIRASYNVSSITDNGTGSYTVNFTNAMPDVNYAVAGGAGTNSAGNGYRWLAVGSNQLSDFSMTTTSVRVQTVYDGTNKTDAEFAAVAIFR